MGSWSSFLKFLHSKGTVNFDNLVILRISFLLQKMGVRVRLGGGVGRRLIVFS